MDQDAWLGLVCGAVIGLLCGLWHARDLRRPMSAAVPGPAVVNAGLRLLLVMAALFVAWRWAGANKYWLTGSLAVAYTAPFLWSLSNVWRRK